MKQIQFALILLLSVPGACTWVKPTAEGEKVVVANAEHVMQCKKISTTTFSVKHKIGSMDRKQEKVSGELMTLAKNEAAARDGDTVVSHGPVKEGSMTFDIYRCGD